MTKRENALQRIKYYGYHESSKWQIVYIENRISRAVATEWYLKGRDAKKAGVKCNCEECSKASV